MQKESIARVTREMNQLTTTTDPDILLNVSTLPDRYAVSPSIIRHTRSAGMLDTTFMYLHLFDFTLA